MKNADIELELLKEAYSLKEFLKKVKVGDDSQKEEDMFTTEELRKVGFSIKELFEERKSSGWGTSAIIADCKRAGFKLTEFKEAGFTAESLVNLDSCWKTINEQAFTAKEIYEAGYTAQEAGEVYQEGLAISKSTEGDYGRSENRLEKWEKRLIENRRIWLYQLKKYYPEDELPQGESALADRWRSSSQRP